LTAFGGVAINTELQTNRSATFSFLVVIYSTGDRLATGIAMNSPNASAVSMPGLNTARTPRR
jgi:hypothetical protein